MEQAWRVIITIVLIAVLLGSISIGVGVITGGSIDRVYTGLQGKYNVQGYYEAYSDYFRESASIILGGSGSGQA